MVKTTYIVEGQSITQNFFATTPLMTNVVCGRLVFFSIDTTKVGQIMVWLTVFYSKLLQSYILKQ